MARKQSYRSKIRYCGNCGCCDNQHKLIRTDLSDSGYLCEDCYYEVENSDNDDWYLNVDNKGLNYDY